MPEQFAIYLKDLLQGDMGRSLISRSDVSELVATSLGASLQLGLSAMLISLVVGGFLGVIAAAQRDRPAEKAVKFIALFGQSVPPFVTGILLIQIFAVWLNILPAGLKGGIQHLILPSVTLSFFGIAGVARLLHSSMLEVLDGEFIKFARAKGVPERLVIFKHALRNALLPVVGFSGLLLLQLISFAFVVEVVFAWPGIGLLTFNAIINRDFPVIQGVVLLTGALAIFLNFAADFLYAYLDPRIRYGQR